MNAVEFAIKVLAFDDTLMDELKKIEAEGFQQLPGLKPVITYMVFRNIQPPQTTGAAAGLGTMQIDDSQVHIIRDGKTVFN